MRFSHFVSVFHDLIKQMEFYQNILNVKNLIYLVEAELINFLAANASLSS